MNDFNHHIPVDDDTDAVPFGRYTICTTNYNTSKEAHHRSLMSLELRTWDDLAKLEKYNPVVTDSEFGGKDVTLDIDADKCTVLVCLDPCCATPAPRTSLGFSGENMPCTLRRKRIMLKMYEKLSVYVLRPKK